MWSSREIFDFEFFNRLLTENIPYQSIGDSQMKSRYALVIIVIAELFGGSLWFSVNAIADTLYRNGVITTVDIGHLTSAVQFGFIVGTLFFALSGLADRYSASRIFAICAIAGAVTNAAFISVESDFTRALILRFVTGVTLAGIYPIAMKLIISWSPDKAGLALGWLVGTLALGTGLPHFIRGIGVIPTWQAMMMITSLLAVLAAVMVWWLGDGPHPGNNRRLQWGAALQAFRIPEFRATACGYFGHMWELYAFWALLPLLIAQNSRDLNEHTVSLFAFGIFVAGGIGCILGGLFSVRWGSAKIAMIALAGSAILCLVYPWLQAMPHPFALLLLLVWGFFVVADSPQFSALAAKTCAADRVGGTLALMNSIGFAISIVSIELSSMLWSAASSYIAWLLLPGPVFGLLAMRRMWHRT